MPQKNKEIELKLMLPSSDAEQDVINKISSHGYKCKQIKPLTNIDIYLDTFDWRLLKKKYSLRYRSADGSFFYTVKGQEQIQNGIAQRVEKEIRLDEPAAIPAICPRKEVNEIIEPIIFPRRLLEQIQIKTNRRRYRVVSPEKAVFELCFDSSSFAARGMNKQRRASRLFEMETELQKGGLSALESLAALLKKEFGYIPSTASKLQTAMERLKISPPAKKPPRQLQVELDDRMDIALKKIIAYQFQRFEENSKGIKADIDTEFVHQARVATRRMRSALLLFGEAIPAATKNHFRSELKWLGEILGKVRDLDVFLLNLPQFKMNIGRFSAKRQKAFADWIEMHRRLPFTELIQALESVRYKNLAKKIINYSSAKPPARPPAHLAAKKVRDAAPQIIKNNLDAVIRQGEKIIANPRLKEFHRLRINMKKLRYACEFVNGAYEGRLDDFIAFTVDIQDNLGKIQDTAFTRNFIDFLFADMTGKLVDPKMVFILGEIYQLQKDIEKQQRELFSGLWEKFSQKEQINKMTEIIFTNE